MPQPEQVAAASAALVASYGSAWAEIEAALASMAADPESWTALRLRRFASSASTRLDALDNEARAWFEDGFAAVYRLGAEDAAASLTAAGVAASFGWSAEHVAAVTERARAHHGELAAATATLRATLRRLVRRMAASSDFAATLAEARPYAARYADRSRHGLAEYASVVLATATAAAYNAGTVNLSRSFGVERFDVSDGVKDEVCAAANGSVVDADWAMSNPLGHPRCQRQFSPRVSAA